MDLYVEKFLDWWHSATMRDYGHVLLGVVVIGWFVSRYQK